MRPQACAGRYGDRPYLRGDRRGRAAGPPGDPPCCGASGRARGSWSPAAARRWRRAPMPPWPRSTTSSAMPRSCGRRPGLQLADGAGAPRLQVGDIMAERARTAPSRSTAWTAGRGPSSRSSRLRPSLHLLHHPLRPRPEPQRAAGGDRRPGTRCWSTAAIVELVRHRRRHRLLRPGSAGPAWAGPMLRRLLAAVPELPRLRLSSLDPAEHRPRSARPGRRRAAPDAAPASRRAGRRRPGAQAHEAAARCGPTWSACAASLRAAAARPRLRRRPDRRLSRPRTRRCSSARSIWSRRPG